MASEPPGLVTIAIPTFNRSGLLPRAVASAQAQDYPHIEICIVDNHSTDETPEVGRALAASDPRIRFIRQPRNVGSVRNFEMGLANASGEYFCWLADDDWLDGDYVRLCVDSLEADGHALVIGREEWDGPALIAERAVNALEPDPLTRAVHYVTVVASNVAFYAVGRTQDFRDTLPLQRRINGDIVWVAMLLQKGTLGVVEATAIHRRVGGESADLRTLAAQLERGWFPRRFPRAAIPLETVNGLFEAEAEFLAGDARGRDRLADVLVRHA